MVTETNTLTRRLWWAVRPLWAWRLVRLLVRSVWLAGLVTLGGWLLTATAGWALGPREWTLLGGGALLVVFILQALWPVPADRLAGRLDRRYQLLDQLTAAYEVAARGPQNYIEHELLAAADATLSDLRRQWRFTVAIPWNDLLLAGVVGTALVAAAYGLAAQQAVPAPTLTHAAYQALPPVGLEPLVDLPGVPAAYQPAHAGQVTDAANAQAGAEDAQGLAQSAAAQEVLDALAEALSIPSLTQSAGTALAQGDTERAADELRSLAQEAEGIGSDARQALVEAMAQAAERLADSAPEVSEQLNEDGGALTQNQSDAAAQTSATADALESLAQMIEQAGSQRVNPNQTNDAPGDSNTSGAGSNNQSSEGADGQDGDTSDATGGQTGGTGAGNRGAPEEQGTGSLESLRAAGGAVPLPPSESLDPGSLRPAENPGQAHARRSVPYAYLDASGAGGAQPSDPLSIPWRLRNVIQRYFSPP